MIILEFGLSLFSLSLVNYTKFKKKANKKTQRLRYDMSDDIVVDKTLVKTLNSYLKIHTNLKKPRKNKFLDLFNHE